MKRNGSLITNGREWPLFEQESTEWFGIGELPQSRPIIAPVLLPEDQAAIDRTTGIISHPWD